MMTFKEFLKSREATLRAEAETNDRLKKQWEDAVSGLMSTIKDWIIESDPEKLLKLKEGTITLYDQKIDQTPLPSIKIWMGSSVVSIEPIAQNVIGPRLKPMEEGEWSGRVDMIGHPYSFELWLFINNKGVPSWHIRNDRDFTIRPLNKETFERAMVELLS